MPHTPSKLRDTESQQRILVSSGPGEVLEATPRLNLGHRRRGQQRLELLPVLHNNLFQPLQTLRAPTHRSPPFPPKPLPPNQRLWAGFHRAETITYRPLSGPFRHDVASGYRPLSCTPFTALPETTVTFGDVNSSGNIATPLTTNLWGDTSTSFETRSTPFLAAYPGDTEH